MDKSRISIAFTNYNRTELLFEAIAPFINDLRVDEIVISDDCSDIEIYNTVVWKYNGIDKVKIFRNEVTKDCYFNKRQAVKRSTSDWVALLDSDNIFGTDFIDAIFSQKPWNQTWAYAPEFARPHFNFTAISGTAISRNNVGSILPNGNCGTMLNAMNYFVNREEYLRIWDKSIDPVTSDSLFHNYNWLKGGNTIYVTPGLQYEHRVHEGSHYKQNVRRTPEGLHDELIEKLKRL